MHNTALVAEVRSLREALQTAQGQAPGAAGAGAH